jgi:uncharacterized protein (TIGR03000 family)
LGSVFVLGAAVVLVTPSPGQAQRGGHGGGGHFGGGHFGGAHFGGAHFGGARGGFHSGGAGLGGFHHGVSGFRGFHHGYPYSHYGYRRYFPYSGYSYPYSYGSYYPDSYGSASDYSDYGSYGYVAPSDTYESQSYYPSATATAPPDSTADVTVNVPADARIWFDGTATKLTGPIRQFATPALKPGTRYHYEVRASWKENGHEVTQTQQVSVRAGAHVRVNFPVAHKAER